jgi:PAS domain S-box-containing protein
VTEARRAVESRLLLSAIVESSDDAIISRDVDGTIVSWNNGAERLYGYTADEVIGRPLAMLVPPDHPEELPDLMERLARGERVEHFETVRLRKDGGRVDVSLTISPVRDAEGRLVGASKIARDITAQKREEQRTRFLADASAILAELTDFESTLQRIAALAVPAFADLCTVDVRDADGSVRRLAVTSADPAKKTLVEELWRFPPRPTDKAGIMRVLRTGAAEWSQTVPDSLLQELAHDGEHLRVLRDLGRKSYISVPLLSRGRTLGVLSFAMAESGRSYRAGDVRAAEDLANRAAIAIENASLLSALRESDQRKDEFLAVLAHELRNPLAPLKNALQLLQLKGPPTPELQWARQVIERQVSQMTHLVDDLLDVSRIRSGKIELRKQKVELAAVVHSAVETSRPLIEKWGHELTVTIPPEPIYLDADLTRLSQVLLNLLNNAGKFTEPGGRIALLAERDGDQVLIRVKDTGIGIPPQMLTRIFEMFTQIGHPLDRSQGGLGIGLTLVKRLTEIHGGSVEARSPGPGKGSEFIVRLPAAGGGETWEAPRAAGQETASTPPSRVLVVDDSPDAADSLAMLLRFSGHQVETAHDGLEAVEAASRFQPDIVLLDIGLPKLNGYDAGRRIREALGDRVVLIALTGWGQDQDRARSKEAGFDHHMTKPISFDALEDLLARTVIPRRALQEPRDSVV